MSSSNLEQARHNMVEQQVRPWDVLDPKILHILDDTPREAYVAEAYRALAYADTAIPLGNGHFMMHPVVEGRMLQSLDIQPTDNALEIGTGSGYVTACMAQLAAHVDSMEIDPAISEAAAARLQQQNIYNVRLTVADGVTDFDDSKKYDVICITGSLVNMLDQYKNALTIGGRLFVILGEDPIMQAHLFTRTGENAWADQILFETSVKALRHGEKPRQFVF